jgi:anti-sigma B factor antagonist
MPSSGEWFTSTARSDAAGWAGLGVHVEEVADAGTVVQVSGELDTATAGPLEDGLWLASMMPHDRLVLDFARLTFMDAAGLRIVVAAHERRLAAGRAGVEVRGTSGLVRRIFDLTGLSALLDNGEPLAMSRTVRADGCRCELEAARRLAGLSVADLYVGYFALGGAADRRQLLAYLNGDSKALDRHQRDIAVHAVNERLGDVGRIDQLLSYASA